MSNFLGIFAKWVAVAVIFAVVYARIGGKPRLLDVLRSDGRVAVRSYHCTRQRLGVQAVFQAGSWVNGRGGSIKEQEQGGENHSPLSALQG